METNPLFPRVIAKVNPTSADPLPVGHEDQRFISIVFYGAKGTAETANAAVGYIQLMDYNGTWINAAPLPKGGWSPAFEMESKAHGTFGADQFRVKSGADGDGFIAIVTQRRFA